MAYAATRQVYSWQEFNEWARGVMERTKKHPGVRAIREWWLDNAERVWPHPATRPNVQLAERHAKGLRSKEHIRRYFRKYRAKRKEQKAGNKRRKRQPQEVDGGSHIDGSSEEAGDEDCQTCGSNYSDDERREAAKTRIATLRNRPQRKRLAPSRFRSKNAISGCQNDSCGSESLVDETDDSDGSAYILPHQGIVSYDQPPHACSENEPSQQRERRSVAHRECGKAVGTVELSHFPEKLAIHECKSDFLGACDSHLQEVKNRAFMQALATPKESPLVDLQESLLHLLASASKRPLLLPLGIQPLRSVLLETMGVPMPSQENVSQLAVCLTDMEARAVAGASLAGQSVPFHDVDTPTPGYAKAKSAERLLSRCTPPRAAAAAAVDSTPSSQLRRLISAQLLSTHYADILGYDLAVNANFLHGFAVQPDADMGSAENLFDGTKLSSTEPQTSRDNGADAQPLKTHKRAASDDVGPQRHKKSAGRNVGSDGKVQDVQGTGAASAPLAGSTGQTPQHIDHRAANQPDDPAWADHARSNIFPVPRLAADTVTPLQPWCKQRDGNASPCDLPDPASGDPSTILHLGRMLGSDFGVSQGPELAVWRMPQNGKDADAYTERANQLGASTAVADGSSSTRVGSGTNCETGSGGSLHDSGHQAGIRVPTCTTAPAHIKQDPEESDGGASWIPINETSGSGYDSGYDGGYSSVAAFPGPEALSGLPYPSGVLPLMLGMQHMPLRYVPPAPRQHLGYLTGMPNNGDIWWYAPPLSIGLSWQHLDTRREMFVNAPESGTHFGQDTRYWDRALAVANAAAAAARDLRGQGGTGNNR